LREGGAPSSLGLPVQGLLVALITLSPGSLRDVPGSRVLCLRRGRTACKTGAS